MKILESRKSLYVRVYVMCVCLSVVCVCVSVGAQLATGSNSNAHFRNPKDTSYQTMILKRTLQSLESFKKPFKYFSKTIL